MVANTSFWDGLFFTVYISFRECIDSWHWHIDLTLPIPKSTIHVAATVSVPWILYMAKGRFLPVRRSYRFRFPTFKSSRCDTSFAHQFFLWMKHFKHLLNLLKSVSWNVIRVCFTLPMPRVSSSKSQGFAIEFAIQFEMQFSNKTQMPQCNWTPVPNWAWSLDMDVLQPRKSTDRWQFGDWKMHFRI